MSSSGVRQRSNKRDKPDSQNEQKSANSATAAAGLSSEAKAAKLQEILQRVARREREDADRADQEQKDQDRQEAQDDDERDLMLKIQKTYQKYLDKKRKKAPRVTKEFKDEQRKKDIQAGSISWKYVSYDDLDLLDLGQESNRTALLFLISLVLMILLLFVLISVFAITAIVSYASDEVDQLQQLHQLESSILVHNLFQFLTIMPTALIVLQILINLSLILMESIDEVFFYIRENNQGIWIMKGIFGLSLMLLTGMLAFSLVQNDKAASQNQDDGQVAPDQIQYRHIITCIMACLHALAMMLHAQSKMKDAEQVYMRYLYDKHKKDLPEVDPQNVSSGERSLESDGPDRKVQFI